jgi:hypothetical protein
VSGSRTAGSLVGRLRLLLELLTQVVGFVGPPFMRVTLIRLIGGLGQLAFAAGAAALLLAQPLRLFLIWHRYILSLIRGRPAALRAAPCCRPDR